MRQDEVAQLLAGADDPGLFSAAAALTRENFGTDVYLRGVVEFSNHCRNNCRYCGLRAANGHVHRYRMSVDDVLACAHLARELSIGTIVVQSGDDFSYSRDDIGRIVAGAKADSDVAVTLSLGDRPEDELAYWRDCGADRYLLKIETFDEALYARCRPGLTVADRLNRLEALRRAGYEVGSGVITDLPGMTPEILAKDLLRLADLDLDMLAVGPFVPHPDTPFGHEAPGSILTAFRAMAILRLLAPLANIPSTSALNALRDGAREQGLTVGANVLMPSLTPENVSADYAIYPGKNAFRADARARVEAAREAVRRLGLTPSTAVGGSKRRHHVG
ncbi:[FeFe] hydrogenase H-cluster radical SAM maturase HydE [Desulfovibrio aerotolerans]|uniref:[FeFe] hydrogenase H-cluster radical SAM maturase HydE n=1 Tax=Solidesulfovibrio aerotolerans TaxID=295255 RepID=A0A7C9MIP8_9BACT|nr:[FeFe] hydrogenase H-cluster radical SAM maturase HydE [Solidesulfovibrio aerotolerans]MYL82769.1 [FeFe] hydrogenase H-cluster radical SAM maturase HydE [Solidesulfovibrio aerotolerans]